MWECFEEAEVTQTGHRRCSAGDVIKFDVQNDETLESDKKLVEDAEETTKLVDARGIDSPRVWRNEAKAAQIENSEKLTPAESTSYRSLVMNEVSVCRSGQG